MAKKCGKTLTWDDATFTCTLTGHDVPIHTDEGADRSWLFDPSERVEVGIEPDEPADPLLFGPVAAQIEAVADPVEPEPVDETPVNVEPVPDPDPAPDAEPVEDAS